ncbi:hypothetical protein NW754_007798 [Fusarium falciforme]|nr:hypothetical protein NW754_007798 [Fusarium falciforme]
MSQASSSGSGLNPGRHIINDTTSADHHDALKRAARLAKRRHEAEGSDATSDSGRTFTSYASSSKAKTPMGTESTTDASSVSGLGQESCSSSSSQPKTSSRRPRFPDMPDPEPSTQPSAESTSVREGREKSSFPRPFTEFNLPHKTAGKPQAPRPSTESSTGRKAINECRPSSLSSGRKSSHKAADKLPSSRASDRKPTDQSSSAAQNPSTKDSLPQPPKAARQKKSNRTECDKASQPSLPTPENPPNSPPQDLPRDWNDCRRNTLEKLQSLSLKLQATAWQVSARFWVLVSLLAPFVERASDVFHDALALVLWVCKVSTSAFDMLVPKILVHACMVLFVATGIILFVLSLLAGILKEKYCDAITTMPYSMIPSSATAICLPSSQRNFASPSLLSDTLQGFQARIPGVWQYLENTLDSVDRDLVVARHSDLLLNMGVFRPMYLEGLQESEVLERQFMRQQRALWFNVNHFIRNIRPGRPEPYWILERLGFVNTALVREARDAHQELIEILDNSREQTMTFQRRLSQDSSDVLTPFVKLFNPKTSEFREKLTQMIMAKAASDPGQDDPGDLLGSSALWGASSDVVLDMLFHRHGMLIGDITWLSEKPAELKRNLAILKGRRNVTKEV